MHSVVEAFLDSDHVFELFSNAMVIRVFTTVIIHDVSFRFLQYDNTLIRNKCQPYSFTRSATYSSVASPRSPASTTWET
jgi:hypothetical protein